MKIDMSSELYSELQDILNRFTNGEPVSRTALGIVRKQLLSAWITAYADELKLEEQEHAHE